MLAIIETGGKQYQVEKGTILEIEKLEVEEGSNVDFEDVLLVSDKSDIKIGMPHVDGAIVTAKVIAHTKGDKIVVFKMKAKKRYQKKQGHRQKYTKVEITEIKLGATKSVKAPKTAAKAETPKVEAPKKAPVKKAATKAKATPKKKED